MATTSAAKKLFVDVALVDSRRCRKINSIPFPDRPGPVVYWMSRDQRSEDNWALLYAQGLAKQQKVPLHVVFCLVPKFLDATIRQFDFMLRGLREVEQDLISKDIPFHLKMGLASNEVPAFCKEQEASAVVCDMAPLRVPMQWTNDVGNALADLNIPLVQVDAHNVVPVWAASDKQEYAARTIRRKIMDSLPTYLKDFPPLEKHPDPPAKDKWPKPVDWDLAEKTLEVDRTVLPVKQFLPGMFEGKKVLEAFCGSKLSKFADKRNDPNSDISSNLSPYLHFGQLAPQRAALAARKAAEKDKKAYAKGCESFIEELVVRRELADNFCFYNPKYDKIEGASAWAQETLKAHQSDKREHIYTAQQLEEGKSHDDLWNAAQLQLVREGKMHGFLRMYWAKKILEWMPTPAEALAEAIRLNDRYELDGRDPNGYVGCMWSICGIHDMGWTERPIFGKIRFMNYAGCKRKFNIPNFVKRYPGATKSVLTFPEAKKRKTD
uniref:Deoxyribodipyrimidine photo-lyase n=1 Tax=Crypthecodinium cohnii TaxID=2866 RepID=A0A516AGL5_CRYCO|nr:CPD photolyase [Crypthecodinium cohnii]USW07795.1 CPD photolyase [Crypthecodinium cohnii]